MTIRKIILDDLDKVYELMNVLYKEKLKKNQIRIEGIYAKCE